MKTPTKERFAGALAKTIYEDLVSPVGQALEKASALFRGLRLKPTIEVDPDDASLRFSFEAGRARAAGIDDTIEKLLELPGKIGAERKKRTALIFDEFQEVAEARPAVSEPDARGLPDPARGRPRLPGQQAPRPGGDLQRQERAVLAKREAGRDRDDPDGQVPHLHRAPVRRHRPRDPRRRPRAPSRASPAVIRTAPRSSPTPSGDRFRKGTSRTWQTSSGR